MHVHIQTHTQKRRKGTTLRYCNVDTEAYSPGREEATNGGPLAACPSPFSAALGLGPLCQGVRWTPVTVPTDCRCKLSSRFSQVELFLATGVLRSTQTTPLRKNSSRLHIGLNGTHPAGTASGRTAQLAK